MTRLIIAPIGTCRLCTPLRRGLARYPITLAMGRNYGFVHTSAEALQQLRFMRSEILFPEAVTGLIFRSGTAGGSDERQPTTVDLHLVEISSSKHVTIEGWPVQLNYTYRYFGEFFRDKARARQFWAMSALDQLVMRDAWLSENASFMRLSMHDRDLLRKLRMEDQTDQQVGADMTEIVDRLGAEKVLFITHVNAQTPDNLPIRSRERLIAVVKATAMRLGAQAYDPTILMRRFGQAAAMEKDGLDLTHYTAAFSDGLCTDWHERYFALRIGSPDSNAHDGASEAATDLQAALEADWSHGDWQGASRRLHAALRDGPAGAWHGQLLGRMKFDLGDYEGVIAQFGTTRASGMDDECELLLMRAHLALQNWAESLRSGRLLLADEVETPEILRCCGIAAASLGIDDEAIDFWKRLFASGEHCPETISSVITLLARLNRHDEAAIWCEDVLRVEPAHAGAFRHLWMHRCGIGDRVGLLALTGIKTRLPDDDVSVLAEVAASRHLYGPAAQLMANQSAGAQAGSLLAGHATASASRWIKQAAALVGVRKFIEAADLIEASWLLVPKDRTLIALKRSLAQGLRLEVRRAFLAADHVRVIAICKAALRVNSHFPEIDSFLGRSAAAAGQTDLALLHLRLAADEGSDEARIQLARTALNAGRHLEALQAYGSLAVAGAAEDAEMRAKARRQLAAMTSRAVHAARGMTAQQPAQASLLLEEILRHEPANVPAQRELAKLRLGLRKRLLATDKANARDRLTLATAILEITPDDPFALKIAGVSAMRLHHFEAALANWRALRELKSDRRQIDLNIAKCNLWIRRSAAPARPQEVAA